ncbi:MAG: ATP-binding protein [Hydrotalea sp. AMD]|uniref:AlbA family DNA-binding domain-containing protein n=1 Tax=Hydrotalea sp. AMD TaxID=2501297 RepID=UPI0009425F67|nr:ATP-binding protein [Hydrotalea sp. AMD]RTL47555.1 MAG: ATP-binding protein [Sphingobacteriales bacterium]RWZ88112.1 MAG: ATP-binding protein [Hydrotalea sp. AMD]
MQIVKISKQWLWIISGSLFGLLVFAPLLLTLFEYHFGKHQLPFMQVVINFYREAVKIDFVSGSLFVLFLFIGGTLGYLLFRLKSSKNKNNLDPAIADLLIKGECDTIEFKSSFRWDYRLQKISKEIEFASLKTIAAFMNSADGTLLIGVADDASLTGLDKDYKSLKKCGRDGFEQYIMQSVSLCLGIENCKNLQVSFVVSNDKEVCMIKVKSTKKPVFLKHQQNTHFFVRAGNGTRELNIQEALKYIKAST